LAFSVASSLVAFDLHTLVIKAFYLTSCVSLIMEGRLGQSIFASLIDSQEEMENLSTHIFKNSLLI